MGHAWLTIHWSGNCKQNVLTALAIFHETTAAVIQSYFPEEISTGQFLKLFSRWWVISNSKTAFSTNNYLGNAAVNGDQKPSFLRAMAEWIQVWLPETIPNYEKFALTAQTGSTLVRTHLYLVSLIEDLLGEEYDFVLTSRFQSNPLERQFEQYWKMSGGRFLVGLRDGTSSEKIIKITSLLKEDLDIDNVMYRLKTLTIMKQLVDCLVTQASCSVLQNIFLYQMTAVK